MSIALMQETRRAVAALSVALCSATMFPVHGAAAQDGSAPPALQDTAASRERPKKQRSLPEAAVPVQAIRETAVLLAPSPTLSPTFGMVNGISGDRIVVMGPDVVRSPGVAGQVATFTLGPMGTWEPIAEMLSIGDCRNGDLIMGRVALSGTVLCLSHERRDGSSSLVEVFEPSVDATSGWVAAGAPLGPPSGTLEPAFGSAIATDGRHIAVSCVDQRVLAGQSRTVTPAPKVFLFKSGPTGWSGLGFLQREAGKDPKFFGASLAMTPGRLVVGCPKAIQPAPQQPLVQGGEPTVCIWSASEGSWSLEAELAPPPSVEYLGFGQIVAASEQLIVVRAGFITSPGAEVFVYRKADSGWTFDGALAFEPDVVKGPAFGASFAAGDDFIVLGDSSADFRGGKGIVSIFVRTDEGWREAARLQPSVKTSSARWGVSIRVDGRRTLVAHPANERDGIVPGGGILFTIPPVSDLKVPAAVPSPTNASNVPLGKQ
jgi:hypothetical protein